MLAAITSLTVITLEQITMLSMLQHNMKLFIQGNRTPLLDDAAKIFMALTFIFLPISTTLLNVFYLLTAITLLAAGDWKNRFRKISKNPIVIGFLLVGALYLFGVFYSSGSLYERSLDVLKHHWVYLTPLLLLAFSEPKWQRYCLNLLLMVMTLTLVISFLKYLNIIPHTGYAINRGNVFKDHIIQGLFMGYACSLCLYRSLTEAKYRWIYVVIFMLMSLNILFMSTSRTGYVIYFIFTGYVFVHCYRYKGILISIIVLGTVLALSITLSTNMRLRIQATQHSTKLYHAHDISSTSMGIRYTTLENGIKLFLKKPWIGYGSGSIHGLNKTLPTKDQFAPGWVIKRTEIGYINILVPFGTLGILIFAYLFFLLFYHSKDLQPEVKFALRSYLIVYLVGAAANPWFTSTTEVHMFSMIVALAFGNYHSGKN